MEHYVTIFDSLFLPQGLALHQSLSRHAGPFTLWVVCVDDLAADTLLKLDLPNLRPLRLSDLEDPRLRDVKPTRSAGEYCWTLTPCAFKFVMARAPEARRVTYVDADLWLRQSPRPVFDELERSGKTVLITDHAYAPEHDQSEASGIYCVQFLTFYRDPGAETVRQWWEDRCIEWCFARHEEGRFGDQKYLDVWPQQFGDHVHVLQDKERFLAPWNATRFPRANAVAYHFHSLRMLADRQVFLVGNYALPEGVIQHIYQPYLADLSAAVALMGKAGLAARPQKATPEVRKKSAMSQLWRQLRGKPLAVDHTRLSPLP